MSYRKILFFLFSSLLSFFVVNWMDGNFYEYISIFLMSYYLCVFVESIGNSYKINQITILFGIFQLLIMPMVVYRVYNNDKSVIELFYNMTVDENDYYGFMVPAMLAMIIGMELQLIRATSSQKIIIQALRQCRLYLQGKSGIGKVFIAVGIVSGFVSVFLPAGLDYVGYLLGKLLFVGIFYILFSDVKNKKLYIIGGLSALVIQTIINGMFGELIYTSMLGFLLFILGKKTSYYKKMSLAIIGALFVLILQSIKSEYRKATWYGLGDKNQSSGQVFFNLILDRVSNPELFFYKENNFAFVVRFNQGMLQAKVMNYVPKVRPYAGGSTIVNSILASFVPRILWPDKPKSGGHWNMEYFTGFIVEGYSMNIGPFGESYGNFGQSGGIIFMFFYGLFFSLAFYTILKISKSKPTIILWIPILFLNSIQVETDILMTVNSLIKNSLFVAFCYWATDRFMRIKI